MTLLNVNGIWIFSSQMPFRVSTKIIAMILSAENDFENFDNFR